MRQVKSDIAKHDSIDRRLDSIPDISNKVTDLNTVLAWIDRLVEVSENDKDSSNNWFLQWLQKAYSC